MKKYTIYAAGIDGPEAFNMAFAIFDDFTVSRGFGLSNGEVRKFVIITVFLPVEDATTVSRLVTKFQAMNDGGRAYATEEDVQVLP